MKKKQNNNIVYLVVISAADDFVVKSIHKTYSGSLKRWDEVRQELIKNMKEEKNQLSSKIFNMMYMPMIKNLSCDDPKKINNYPHDTPRILKMELEK